MCGVSLVGSLVLVAEIDLGKAGLLVVGDEEAGLAKITNLVGEVDGSAVRNGGDARKGVSSNVETSDAILTLQCLGSEGGVEVGSASEDFRHAGLLVRCKRVSIVASLTEILVTHVDSTVVDFSQANVSSGAESGEIGVTLNAKTQAVVDHAVSDRSGDASSPVRGLSVSGGASGAKVGAGNVSITVGDTPQATIVNQESCFGASEADGSRRITAVVNASWNVSHDDADLTVAEVVALLASNTVALVVDAGAVGVTASHAAAFDSEVESVDVAGHAVKAVLVPENTAVAGCGRSDHRVLRVGPNDHQTQRESEDR